MSNTIARRLEDFINYLSVSQNEFGKQLGFSSGLISQITSGKSNFGIDKLVKISNAHPDLNLEWLVSGKGSMLKSKREFQKELSDILKEKGIAVVDRDKQDEEEQFVYLPFKDFQSPGIKCFKVNNDEMSPAFLIGDYVLCELNQNWKYNLYPSECCLIQLKQKFLIRRFAEVIHKNNAPEFYFFADNEAFPLQHIPVNEIVNVWSIKSVIKFSLTRQNLVLPGRNLPKALAAGKDGEMGNFISTIFRPTETDEVVTLYFGKLTNSIKNNILNNIKQYISDKKISQKHAKELFSACASSLITEEENNHRSAFFSLRNNKGRFTAITGILFSKEILSKIKAEIVAEPDLKKLYKKVVSSKKTLGDLDELFLNFLNLMTRRNKINYEFIEFEDNLEFFLVQNTIHWD